MNFLVIVNIFHAFILNNFERLCKLNESYTFNDLVSDVTIFKVFLLNFMYMIYILRLLL